MRDWLFITILRVDRDKIKGIDISENMLKIAKKKSPTVKYELSDIYTLDGKEKYDLIVGNAILHHLKDYQACIDQSKKLLKPGGVIFFGAEPNYYSYHYLGIFKNILRKVCPDKRAMKTKKTKEELEKYAEYHMYFSDGINPFELKQSFVKDGFSQVNLRFSSRELFASFIDRMNFSIIDFIPNKVLDSTWVFSRLFYIKAIK